MNKKWNFGTLCNKVVQNAINFFFYQIKVLLGLLQIETFFLLNSNSIIAYISNCNILVVLKREEEWKLSVKNNMSKNRKDEKRICHYTVIYGTAQKQWPTVEKPNN